MVMNNYCNNILSGESRSNVTVLQEMINIRDGVKECDSLGIDHVI